MNAIAHGRLYKLYLVGLIVTGFALWLIVCAHQNDMAWFGVWIGFCIAAGLAHLALMNWAPVWCDTSGCMGRMRLSISVVSQNLVFRRNRIQYRCPLCESIHTTDFFLPAFTIEAG